MPQDEVVSLVEDVVGSETEEACELELQEPDGQKKYMNNLYGKEILQLKVNFIPRDLFPLENIFDSNDVSKEPQLVPSYEDVEDVNIGTEENPNIIKISRTLLSEAE